MKGIWAWLAASVILFAATMATASTKAERDAERQQRDLALSEKLRMLAPSAVEPFDQANKAYFGGQRDNLDDADRGYARVLEIAPTFSPAMRRRAVVLAQKGQRTEGLVLARKAVAIDDSVENETALASVLVTDEGRTVPHADALEAKRIIDATLLRAPDDYQVVLTRCNISIAADDLDGLKWCSRRATALAPDDPAAQVFAALAAGSSGDRDGVHDAVAKGRASGLDAETASKLEQLGEQNESSWSKWGPLGLKILAGWLAGLALLLGLGAILSRATLGVAGDLAHEGTHARAATLRSVYRVVLHITCLYYYLSIPVVLAVCIVAGGGVIVGFFMLGHIPIKLVIVIVLVVAYTVWAVIKSILFRPKEQEPGKLLSLRDHPKLRAMLDEVAKRVDTRSVDNVYLTPDVSLAVLERGGLSKQLRGRTERCLVLGVAALDGMKLGPFKAILAHEYGHFSNRDTAGGGFALAVRRSLLLTMIGLATSGAATWYNPAWWFVVGFQRLFLRVSQGASRLQEMMADRWAAVSYGAESFARGLSHVVRRTIEFDAHAQTTLAEVIERDRALKNLYAYEPKDRPKEKEIEKAFAKAMRREPSPYDSHPRPVDRIAWVRELACSTAPLADDENDAWDLFENKEAIQREMTDEIRAAVQRNHGVVIASRKKKRPPQEGEAPPPPDA